MGRFEGAEGEGRGHEGSSRGLSGGHTEAPITGEGGKGRGVGGFQKHLGVRQAGPSEPRGARASLSLCANTEPVSPVSVPPGMCSRRACLTSTPLSPPSGSGKRPGKKTGISGRSSTSTASRRYESALSQRGPRSVAFPSQGWCPPARLTRGACVLGPRDGESGV